MNGQMSTKGPKTGLLTSRRAERYWQNPISGDAELRKSVTIFNMVKPREAPGPAITCAPHNSPSMELPGELQRASVGYKVTVTEMTWNFSGIPGLKT